MESLVQLRLGNLTPGASYTVRLHFAEPSFSDAGRRQFNASLNGTEVLTDFDIVATAGGKDKAVVAELTATADGNGQIREFHSGGGGLAVGQRHRSAFRRRGGAGDQLRAVGGRHDHHQAQQLHQRGNASNGETLAIQSSVTIDNPGQIAGASTSNYDLR